MLNLSLKWLQKQFFLITQPDLLISYLDLWVSADFPTFKSVTNSISSPYFCMNISLIWFLIISCLSLYPILKATSSLPYLIWHLINLPLFQDKVQTLQHSMQKSFWDDPILFIKILGLGYSSVVKNACIAYVKPWVQSPGLEGIKLQSLHHVNCYQFNNIFPSCNLWNSFINWYSKPMQIFYII